MESSNFFIFSLYSFLVVSNCDCKFIIVFVKEVVISSADKTFSYFGEEPIVNEVYAKTFMGKTVLQLLSDMRVKGRNYKLDAIYNGDMYNPIFYNLVTLKSFNPLYKEFINDILFKKKYNK